MTTVAVSYMHANKVSHSFMDCLIGLTSYEQEHEKRLRVRIPVATGVDSMDKARNYAVQSFLDETEYDWLWFLDTDIGFPTNALDLLLEAGDTEERPVVGGMYFSPAEVVTDKMGGWDYKTEPVVYGWGPVPDGNEGLRVLDSWPDNSIFPVSAMGTGCLLIHRNILTKIRESEGDVWFNYLHYVSGERISEDLSFCLRLQKYDTQPFVHTGLPLSHHKEVWIKS